MSAGAPGRGGLVHVECVGGLAVLLVIRALALAVATCNSLDSRPAPPRAPPRRPSSALSRLGLPLPRAPAAAARGPRRASTGSQAMSKPDLITRKHISNIHTESHVSRTIENGLVEPRPQLVVVQTRRPRPGPPRDLG